MAGESLRSRALVDGGARLLIRGRAPSFAVALAQLAQLVAEEGAALGPDWYPIHAEASKRSEGAGCRLLATFQRAGARERSGAHAARAARRREP